MPTIEETQACGCAKTAHMDEGGQIDQITFTPCEQLRPNLTDTYNEVSERGASILDIAP